MVELRVVTHGTISIVIWNVIFRLDWGINFIMTLGGGGSRYFAGGGAVLCMG